MPTYEELRAAADNVWASVETPSRPLFVVSMNTSSIAGGARETYDALVALGESQGFDVMQTGDAGFAFMEPVIEVRKPNGSHILYGHITADKVPGFASAAVAGVATEHAVASIAGDVAGLPRLGDLDWMKLQVRWLMYNCGVIDPENIDHYIARGGYSHFNAATTVDRDELINVIKGSTLRGHSGSFFSTGMKWSFLKDAKAEPKYLVCNADEGDPGAWVNRVVMESDPHMLIEGLLIGAYATGATYGWIYVRDEYPLAVERLNKALAICRERGILGENALGTGVNFDAEVVRGAGAYVCGDETGLISSINDERGMPRIKPPFPAQSGVLGLPTNVNNVETYASVTTLLRVTPEGFSEVGTEANRGTKMFTVSGACARSGCMEVPFGTKVSEVLQLAGGIANGREFKALQQGGPLSGLLPASVAADLPLEPEPFRPLGAGMGGGGLIFVDDTACVINLNVMFTWFLEDESCGRCTTCRGGNQRMLEIMKRTARGDGDPADPDRIKSLAASMQYSNCFHGSLSPVITNNIMQFFREEYDAHALQHRCPAKVCNDLVRYVVVNPNSGKIAEATKISPTGRIVQEQGRSVIEDETGILQAICRDIAAEDIVIEDRFTDTIPLHTIRPADVARAGG